MTGGDGTAASGSFARGTILGDSLREHWIPVLPADVLDRQQARRVRLLGEDLVCFRDRSGTYGLIGVRCPHRGVSLEWGFAAKVGLRCAYHGWCFDSSGRCIDIPLEGSAVRDEISVPAYPLENHGGMLFGYLGEGAPPAPAFDELVPCGGVREIRFATAEALWRDPPADEDTVDPRATLSDKESPFLCIEEGRPRTASMRVPIDDTHTLLIECGLFDDADVVVADQVVDSSEEVPRVGLDGGRAREERDVGPSSQLATALAGADEALGASARDDVRRWLSTANEHGGARAGVEIDASRCVDLLVHVHLPMWLRALGENGPADELAERADPPSAGAAEAALVAAGLDSARRQLSARFEEVVRQPWSAAWPYVWSAPSSLRWAEVRDGAYAHSWRTTWRDASDALELAGSAALLRAAMRQRGSLRDGLCVVAFRGCEVAARALRWPGAWAKAWADAANKNVAAATAAGGDELVEVAVAIRRTTLPLIANAEEPA